MDFRGSGDTTQLDCVDEATNTTSYILVLDRHGLIRHHRVERPLRQGQPHTLDALGGGDPGAGKRRAFRHQFIERPERRQSDGAGGGKFLRAGQLCRQRAAGARARRSGGEREPGTEIPTQLTRMLERMQASGYAEDPTGAAR